MTGRHLPESTRARGWALALIVATGLLALLPSVAARAATIHVPADRPSIQLAIDAAVAGDTVLVAPGTYYGAENQNIDFRGRDIVLRSEAGPEATIIDCENIDRAFYLRAGETNSAVIDGFSVLRGMATYLDPYGVVGGAVVCASSSPTIRNMILGVCGAG